MQHIAYISSAYTGATSTHKNNVQNLKSALRKSGITVLEWVSEGIAGSDLFRRDLQNVRTSTFVVALVDLPSIGVGFEIGEAMRENKPILCLHSEGVPVSRLLLSAVSVYRNLRIRSFRTIDEAVAHVHSFAEKPLMEV